MERIGKYEILETIGSGAMGTVFKGYDRVLDRYVAIKSLFPQYVNDTEKVSRFLKEARALAQLSHANIVCIHDLYQEQGIPFIVMEYLQGKNLRQLLMAGARFTVPQILNILFQCGEGLEYAHQINVVHRDVKPANIILTGKGNVKIVDFGIAMLVESTSFTHSGGTMGTLTYMSPEQARDERVDHRTDQYALGVMAYEMILGSNPFEVENPSGILYKILCHSPAPLADTVADCPKELSQVLMRMIDKERGKRYPGLQPLIETCGGLLKEYGVEEIRLDLIYREIVSQDAEPPPTSITPTIVTHPPDLAIESGTRPAGESLPSRKYDAAGTNEDCLRPEERLIYPPASRHEIVKFPPRRKITAAFGHPFFRHPAIWSAAVLSGIFLMVWFAVLPGWKKPDGGGGSQSGKTGVSSPGIRPGTGYFGGIEIGASGVKSIVVSIGQDPETAMAMEEKMRRDTTTTIVTFSDGAIRDTVDEIARIIRVMRMEYKVPDNRILIVGSSGVVEAAHKKGPRAVERLDVLKQAVWQAVGIGMDYLSNDKEAEYGAMGLLPPDQLAASLALDIGSGNTKGGYFEGADSAHRFVSMDIPFGTKSIIQVADQSCGAGTPIETCLQRVLLEKIVPVLQEELDRKPGLVNRPKAYFTGGIVWAMITLTHPEKQDDLIPFSDGDIQVFYQQLLKNPAAVLSPDLSVIPDPRGRERAAAQIQKVRDTFHQRQLLAGAALLALLAEKLSLADKELYFRNQGQLGWLTSCVERHARGKPL